MEDGLQGRITWYRGKVRYSTSQLESHGNYKPFGRGLTISGLGHVLILVIYHLLTGVDPGIRRAGGSQDLFSCGKYGDLKGMSTLGRMEHSKWFQIAATNVIFESLGASMKEFLIYGSWHRWGISFTSGKSSIFRQRFWKYHNFSRFIQFILFLSHITNHKKLQNSWHVKFSVFCQYRNTIILDRCVSPLNIFLENGVPPYTAPLETATLCKIQVLIEGVIHTWVVTTQIFFHFHLGSLGKMNPFLPSILFKWGGLKPATRYHFPRTPRYENSTSQPPLWRATNQIS